MQQLLVLMIPEQIHRNGHILQTPDQLGRNGLIILLQHLIFQRTYDENVIQIKNKDVAGNESTIVKNSSSFTIDRTATTIIDISTNKADGTYKEGEEINNSYFSENVNLVGGNLVLTLNSGGSVNITF